MKLETTEFVFFCFLCLFVSRADFLETSLGLYLRDLSSLRPVVRLTRQDRLHAGIYGRFHFRDSVHSTSSPSELSSSRSIRSTLSTSYDNVSVLCPPCSTCSSYPYAHAILRSSSSTSTILELRSSSSDLFSSPSSYLSTSGSFLSRGEEVAAVADSSISESRRWKEEKDQETSRGPFLRTEGQWGQSLHQLDSRPRTS